MLGSLPDEFTPGSFGMLARSDFFARDASTETFFNFRLRGEILADCDPNVFQRLLACRALAVASREVITPNSEPLLRFHQRHVIVHHLKMQHLENFLKTFFFMNSACRRSETGLLSFN